MALTWGPLTSDSPSHGSSYFCMKNPILVGGGALQFGERLGNNYKAYNSMYGDNPHCSGIKFSNDSDRIR